MKNINQANYNLVAEPKIAFVKSQKYQKHDMDFLNQRFSDVLRGYRKATLA